MKKINYTFAAVPKELISDPNISPLEFRILCVILSAADENFNCTLSYSNIAKAVNISRRNTIVNIQNLVDLGYLTKKGRNGFQHNNSIANILHFEVGKAGTSTTSKQASDSNITSLVSEESPAGDSNITSLVSEESLAGDSSITQSRSSCKSLNNIYLKTKEKEEKETATADGAAVLSMSDGEQVAESSAKNECVEALAAKERQALEIYNSYAFKSDLDFIKYKNKNGDFVYILRPKGKFAGVPVTEAQKLAAEIRNATGLYAGWADYNQRIKGETSITEGV